MFSNIIITTSTIAVVATSIFAPGAGTHVLSTQAFSLEERYPDKFVNNVFSDNILLTLAYFRGVVRNPRDINWNEVKKPFNFSFTLEPDEVFAFHEDVLVEYKGKVKLTTNAHFNSSEGFKSDGYLVGDGVCHFASLIYWTAREAGLNAYAPTNHDFAVIPQVPREYGVSIYNVPGLEVLNANQNLYIRNNKEYPVKFEFVYDGKILRVNILQTE